MLDYYQALQELLSKLTSISQTEQKDLLQATNLILAEDVAVQYNAPQFDNSAMDGYALGGDINGREQWQIVERIAAGDSAEAIHLSTGQAARIFTGAPIPQGTTSVVQQELTAVDNGILKVTQPVKEGANIRRCGEELTKGELLLPAKQKLNPAAIALLASQGYSQVKVYKPLTIYVFSTGNELIEPVKSLSAGKIYDANRYLLLSWLQQSPHHIIDGGILPDNQQQTEQALAKATEQADVIITSGGVSVGEEDHVRAAIMKLGELVFWKLAIKPGKPFAWGNIENTTVFMLPGNPVSSLVTFQQLTIPALKVLAGEPVETAMVKPMMVKTKFAVSKIQPRREFLRIGLTSNKTGLWAEKLPNQGSAMLATCITADALAEIPANSTLSENDLLKVFPLDYKV